MLSTGDIDNNVHPANTLRMADALIKANKRFDMLVIPACATDTETGSAYFNWIRSDYFLPVPSRSGGRQRRHRRAEQGEGAGGEQETEMNTPVPELERRALEYMKSGEYGMEAVAVNAAIIEQAPRNVSAWVRMGRCHLEQRQWDEAVSALRAALQISPTHTVATNLLNEVRKRRALAPTAVQRTMTGFGPREFALVEALPPPTRRRR
jgi:tetratricopeptide (TPR) repeat protein